MKELCGVWYWWSGKCEGWGYGGGEFLEFLFLCLVFIFNFVIGRDFVNGL